MSDSTSRFSGLRQAGERDRGPDGEQGAGPDGAVQDRLELFDQGRPVLQARWVAVGDQSPEGRTKAQLYNEAKNLGIAGRSRMTKDQLQRAVDRKKR